MSYTPPQHSSPRETHAQAIPACGSCQENNTTALRQSDEQFRLVVEAAPYGILMVNPAGRITMVNPQCEVIFGFTQTELIGQSVDILLPPAYRDAHGCHLLAFFANPVRKQMGGLRDLPGLRKNGSQVPVEIGLTPVITPEGMFILATIVDISARKQAEDAQRVLEDQLRQAQKMEAIGTLAGGIAHDFNNVLGAIVGYAEMIRAAVPRQPEIAADVSELLASAQRGRQLVERILTFSRHQSGEKRPIDLRQTVRSVQQLLRATIPATVEVRLSVPEAPARVSGDETAIHQVLMNLAMNSAQAMPSGGLLQIGLRNVYAHDSMVRTHAGLREGHYIVLSVQDTGSGIDPAHRARVFEPFFTTKPVGSGTGLGLAMVHAIMQDHQGVVILESEPDRGTEVRCFFPMLEVETIAGPTVRVGEQEGRGERILLIDDEPSLARVGARRLVALNYEVSEHTDARKALEYFRAHANELDLVVTDYTMPFITGLDLARELIRIRADIPIILLTGFVDEMDEQRMRESGIRKVLRKPVTIEELGDAVRRVLDGG